MNKISSSPERHKFQLEKHIENTDGGDPEFIEMWQNMIQEHKSRESNPEWQKNNLEYDLRSTAWILEKARNSEAYAQNLYAALCNNDFVKNDVFPILKEERWSCSWRYAGGIIADMREQGDYIDWYCSGIRDNSPPDTDEWDKWTDEQKTNWNDIYSKYVSESTVTDEIRNDLLKLGWIVITEESDE